MRKEKKANGQNGLSFRETLRTLAGGYRVVRKITPAFLPCALFNAFLLAMQPLAVLYFSGRILTEITGGRNIATLAWLAGGAVLLTFVATMLRAWLTRVLAVNSDMSAFVRLELLQAERFARMEYAYTEDGKVSERLADIHVKASGNGLGVMMLYHRTMITAQMFFSFALSLALLSGMLAPGAATAQSFATSPMATALLVLLLAASLFISVRTQKVWRTRQEEIYTENAKANTSVWYYNEYIGAEAAAKDIRLYNQSPALMRIYEQAFSMDRWFRFFSLDGKLEGLSEAALTLVGGGAYLLIGLRALAGMYPIGAVVQYVGAITALATAAGALMRFTAQIYNNAVFIKPMLDYLDLPDLLTRGTRPVPESAGRDSVFEFRGVSFQYPGTETFALKDINLTMRAGKRLAVVGLNGGGKTTMIKLLCRLYDPTEGQILLDGVDIREYDIDQYRALFSVVFQDFTLFPLPLGENVAASAAPDLARAEKCLRDAGFAERLGRMPERLSSILYRTFDEEKGVQVSGGEAQKIALARALYRGAPIVILDEPTAALDPIAEAEVYATFDQTIGDKTAVFISHRLSSCRFCDDIAVFEAGKLVQRGPHDTLLGDTGGLYAALWDAQARHYVDTPGAQAG